MVGRGGVEDALDSTAGGEPSSKALEVFMRRGAGLDCS
jgi:hypothetical protein